MIRWRRPAHDALFAVFVVGVLAYGAAFAWYMLGRFDLVNLLRDVNIDDAFYYFQIAYHLAGGEFSTVDGGITRTNGYHPLWLFLITPFYWVFDKTEALFAIKAFEIMLVAGGVALVAGAARVARLPWILLFAALPALYQIPAMLWGLEAAAALFLLGLFLLAVCLFARDPARWRWPLAAAAFALPWVRLEYVAISVAATAALCLVEWSGGFPAPVAGSFPRGHRGGWSSWGRSLLALNAAAPLLGAVAGILAYFAWNAVFFGGPVPVSAASKMFWSQRRWEREGYSLTENSHEYLRNSAFDDELLIALEFCVYAAVVWWFSRRARGRDDWLLLAFLVGLFGLAAGHLAKFAQSVLAVHPQYGSYAWYFVPAYLMGVLVVPARCYVAVWFVRRFLGPEHRRASRLVSSGVVTVGAVFLFGAADFGASFRFVDSARDSELREWEVSSYTTTLVMNRMLPEDSVVGSWSSGVMGYFSRFPVVNLDGLVNSWEFLRARKEGNEGAHRQRYGITHLADINIDSSTQLHGVTFSQLFEAAPLDGRGVFQFEIWMKEPRETSWSGVDHFWERMGPHLERQADGVGLLVDGRLAQAFARDCAPDSVAAWTWAGQEEATILPWTRTSIGFCTGALVLPHDALPPVRVREYRPAIDSTFDVYLVENRLVYVKERCGPEDTDAAFFLAVEPVDPDDLPAARRPHGFDNLDFGFAGRGAMVVGACVVGVPLPEYEVAAVMTGQVEVVEGGYRHLWEGDIRFGPDEADVGERLAGRVAGRRPAIDSDFDVHLVDDSLIYVKERCGPEDTDAAFFLAVEPVDPDDLPAARRPHGFDNLDFGFAGRGARFDGACLVEAPLPEYDVAAIMTGQVVAVEGGYRHLWEGEIRPDGAEAGGRLAGLVAGRLPAIDSDFDVHLVDDSLIYVKEECGPDDVDAAFFLAVEAVDPDDLPAARRGHGFDNLDFRFDERGARFDGACLTEARLPEYGIAAIRTGQVVAVEGGYRHLWEGEIRLGPD